MTRHVLAVDLEDDPSVVASYLEHHTRVWPEALRSLEASGIEATARMPPVFRRT